MRQRRRTYLKEWRIYRNLTQQELASRLDVTHTIISKIENGKRPYSQDFLEAAADALMTDPASLLMRDPSSPDFIWSIWEAIPEASKEQAAAVLKTFAPDAVPQTGSQNKPPKRVRK